MSLLLAVAALLGCSVAGVADSPCAHVETLERTIAVGDATSARIEATRGDLAIIGTVDGDSVRVVGEACAPTAKSVAQIELLGVNKGGEVLVAARIPDGRHFRQARIDLRIEVPADLALDVSDGAGDVALRNVGTTSLEDGSGEIQVDGVNGDLGVRDGSGDVRVSDVDGAVDLRDGSGDVSVKGVGHGVRVLGSGDLAISHVAGDVVVAGDGSGGISVDQIEGDVSVLGDGGGGVRDGRVGGAVDVRK